MFVAPSNSTAPTGDPGDRKSRRPASPASVERMSRRLRSNVPDDQIVVLLLRPVCIVDSLPLRRERLIGFLPGRCDLRLGRGAIGYAIVYGRRLLVGILELISRDIGKGNRRGERRQ